MTTKEIVKSLLKNQMVRKSVPIWAHQTIPYPFYKNGIACLGFYFYPLQRKENKQNIQLPIVQLIVTYPQGNIVSIVASPFFLSTPFDATKTIGQYPNQFLQGKTVQEGDKLYDDYYTACDAYLLEQNITIWQNNFDKVKEDGMEQFFNLFGEQAFPSKNKMISTDDIHRESPPKSQGKMSSRLQRILNNINTNVLAEDCFVSEQAAFEKLIKNFYRDCYSFALIGEFSRGKTTFLNSLFDFNLLPVGEIPTTAVLTKIKHSKESRALFITDKRTAQEYPVSQESLEHFLADTNGHDPEGVLNITTPISWLENKNVAFFDTPGVGDFISKRANITLEAIDKCDCTIMAFSANQACSLSEMEFLRANVLLKATPKCVILITMLDMVKEEERMNVINYIKNKISSIITDVEFWIPQSNISGIASDCINAIGIPAIRQRINQISQSDVQAEQLREIQLTTRVKMLLDTCENSILQVDKIDNLSVEQRQKTLKDLENQKSRLGVVCDSLINQSENMEEALFQSVQTDINAFKDSFILDLKMGIQRTSQPKDWIEKEFPYIVKKAVKNICANLEKKINIQIMTDKRILGEYIKKQLSCEHLEITLPTFCPEEIDAKIDFSQQNLEKTRLILRCLAVASVPVGILTIGPFAALFSGAMALGSEFLMKKKIEEQKTTLEKYLQEKGEEIFDNLEDIMSKYIKQCYNELTISLKKESSGAIERAIEKISIAKNDLEQMPRRANELRQKVAEAKNLLDRLS